MNSWISYLFSSYLVIYKSNAFNFVVLISGQNRLQVKYPFINQYKRAFSL